MHDVQEAGCSVRPRQVLARAPCAVLHGRQRLGRRQHVGQLARHVGGRRAPRQPPRILGQLRQRRLEGRGQQRAAVGHGLVEGGRVGQQVFRVERQVDVCRREERLARRLRAGSRRPC